MKYLLWALYGILGLIGAIVAGVILYFLFVFVCSFFIDTKKEYNQDSKFYRFLLTSTTGIGMKIMRIRYDLVDLDKIPEGKQMLFICNHRSNFDPLISWHILRKHYPSFISKESNFKIPFYGRMIRRCCFMSIDRENPRKAMATIDRASKLLQADEVSIAVYPEGTRSKSCELLPFHNGVLKIAQKANVPVVVLTIQGSESVAKRYPWRSTKVRLKYVGMFDAERVKLSKTSIIADEARDMMIRDLQNDPLKQ
ncbi:MAG: 1-acyl-sn-glycerol-3-phosphate acyltransferase [Clostridiales bacterium]|nr:1-acyl-sn-glycerol-3-phosphate acyltransferase [Clostridiales bacterium]MBR4010300.1 1-acyl-sn-glycerol-3-phosphate acyltransferase [Clostridiales bacterium]